MGKNWLAKIKVHLIRGAAFGVLLFLFSTIGFGDLLISGAVKGLSTKKPSAEVILNKKWVLLGEEFKPEEKTIQISLNLSQKCSEQEAAATYSILGTNLTDSLDKFDDLSFKGSINAATLWPGEYTLATNLSPACSNLEIPTVKFFVSYPFYVAWTLDWEGYDVKDEYLSGISDLAKNSNVPITHFFNPRIYTSGLPEARQNYLTTWVKERKIKNGDAIGLHLHMFEDMVTAAGTSPQKDPAWGTKAKDGYDILLSGYSSNDTIKILEWSKAIFAQNGLGVPVMFRAGGWFADEETLSALQETGFILDSSGRTAYTFGTNRIEGHWNLKAITQPYQPNPADQNLAIDGSGFWEFPNNGGDSWAYTGENLIARFRANFSGTPLGERKIVTYLTHPNYFGKEGPAMVTLFNEVDRYLYTKDAGPVIYINLEEAYTIWAGQR